MFCFPLDIKNFIIHNKFLQNVENPIMVSYPRSGGHWVMTCLELYFNKLILCDSYADDSINSLDISNILLLHSHDGETHHPCYRPALSIIRSNVFVLIRTPVDVLFSWLSVMNRDKTHQIVTEEAIKYKGFLNKWVKFETFTSKKLVISYDSLKINFIAAFSEIVEYFNGTVDADQIKYVENLVTKRHIKDKYPHTICSEVDYDKQRILFSENFGNLIEDIMGA